MQGEQPSVSPARAISASQNLLRMPQVLASIVQRHQRARCAELSRPVRHSRPTRSLVQHHHKHPRPEQRSTAMLLGYGHPLRLGKSRRRSRSEDKKPGPNA